jgi:hypothetical protein
MAKKAAPGPMQSYLVTLNNHHESWKVEATGEEEAIDKVIDQTKSLRDRRNFAARLVDAPTGPPNVPTFPGTLN